MHASPQTLLPSRLSRRDAAIFASVRRCLERTPADFREALRALEAAVAESIPGGRIYLLDRDARGPLVGSLISGVGIVEGSDGVLVERVDARGRRLSLGRLAP